MTKRVPKRPSQSRYSVAPQADIQRSTFDLSYPLKTTFDSGKLIPLPPIEVLPGDSFRLRMTALVRLATPLFPTMDNLHLTSMWFFIPNRLTWENWQRFMGQQDDPDSSTDYVIPVMSGASGIPELSNLDYMGCPIGIAPDNMTISALPLRALFRTYNDWFRDENLQDSYTVSTGDGPDTYGTTLQTPLPRGKRKNYITSSLPWPQKGPGVEIPIGTTAPVLPTGDGTPTFDVGGSGIINEPMQGLVGNGNVEFVGAPNGTADVRWNNPKLYTDLTNATGATINDWREAFQMQKLQERDARGGTRYTEILKSHFRVTSPDSRLQRSELLATGQSPVQMNSVPQTSGSPGATDYTPTPQGNLAAYGQGIINRHGFTKSFVEHGYIIGLVNVRADLNFQQKLDRHWSRQTKYDFYWPALQALGEQPVYRKEVYADGSAGDNEIWGYQERWAEYRSSMGQITGLMRSNAAASLDAWHYALDYETAPSLNATFIEDTPPVERTVAVQDEPEFIMDAWIDIKAARPMPVYSVPGYIDHF